MFASIRPMAARLARASLVHVAHHLQRIFLLQMVQHLFFAHRACGSLVFMRISGLFLCSGG
jgi:hypothetical protein